MPFLVLPLLAAAGGAALWGASELQELEDRAAKLQATVAIVGLLIAAALLWQAYR